MSPNSPSATESPSRTRTRRYSSWAVRACGLFIDMLPALVAFGVAHAFFYLNTTTVNTTVGGVTYTDKVTVGPGIPYFLLLAVAVVYWFINKGYFEGTTGRSLGKVIVRTRTISLESGKPIGAGWGFLRALLVYVEFVLILTCVGAVLWLWPLWDKRNQALLSDKATRAVVMRSHRRKRR